MTPGRKTIVLFGLAVMGLMLFFPPWDAYAVRTGKRVEFVGYSFYTDPPEPEGAAHVAVDRESGALVGTTECRIARNRLIIQILIALLLTAAAMSLVGREDPEEQGRFAAGFRAVLERGRQAERALFEASRNRYASKTPAEHTRATEAFRDLLAELESPVEEALVELRGLQPPARLRSLRISYLTVLESLLTVCRRLPGAIADGDENEIDRWSRALNQSMYLHKQNLKLERRLSSPR